MKSRRNATQILAAVSALAVFACTDSSTPNEPSAKSPSPSFDRSSVAQDRLAALFPDASREVMALPGTVFADNDEVRGKLVFGVENEHAIAGITRSLIARGLSADEFVVEVTAPITRMANLQSSVFRPTQAGVQIHFGGYLCSIGFNADLGAAGGDRSMYTASHCTNTQGGVEGTQYYQPLSSTDNTVIATEAADPVYVAGGSCSAGKVCRSSDASRSLYSASVASARGVIAKTTGVNTGSLTTAATSFTVTEQDNVNTSFTGAIHKVGRTTGWTQGNVTNSCTTVNVSGSNVQLRCQTLVTSSGAAIVGGGDSGSGVFQVISGDNVRLVGILWGGSGSTTFVFSPLKNVQDELGGLTGTADGTGGGGGGGGPPPPPPPPPTCTRGNSGKPCK
ncbi:MAG: hypothetical protein ABI681_04560 [Gemmatimonadales bacterium]